MNINDDVKVIRIFGIFDSDGKIHQLGSVYDKNGICPTLTAARGVCRTDDC